ncbi:MAG: ABC transporter ATP-binding protein [Lachnospiraceae bacterium]|nr:ABC transporter ATP-binding protein [Lachnospiraceae bacterium]
MIRLPGYGIPRVLPFVRRYYKTMGAMLVLGCLSSLLDSAFPVFNRYALDRFVARGTMEGAGLFAVLYFLAIVLFVLIDYVTMILCCRVQIHVGKDLKNAAFAHLQTLSLSYFNRNSVGYVHARVMSDTAKISGLVSWRFMDLVWHGSWIICMVAMMLLLDARLALYVMLLVPVCALIVAVFQKRLITLHRRIREMNARITGLFNEGITGARSIKILVAEEKMEENFRNETDDMHRTGIRAARYTAMFISGVVMTGTVALALVLWQGGKLSADGLMRIGTLSVFTTYALTIMEPVQVIVETITHLIQTQANIERLTSLITTESDVRDTEAVIVRYGDMFTPKRENWEALKGDVVFEDVSFRYPDGDELVLTHFNLDVPFGTSVAIVGETGAGKSTLANLVCRFFEPTEGRVLIDGRDARERSQLWLHSNIGCVLQTPHLFSGSVRENLRYGKPDATDEEIWNALKTVAADEIVRRMEGGLEAEVGEGGNVLSTGEKQLLSIARAILADPRILILDEATSSIDTVTEKKVQDAVATLIRGRTSFVIAHRLSTIVNADVILVVRGGRIVERGTHRELMRRKGYYYELYVRHNL